MKNRVDISIHNFCTVKSVEIYLIAAICQCEEVKAYLFSTYIHHFSFLPFLVELSRFIFLSLLENCSIKIHGKSGINLFEKFYDCQADFLV
jgi:hypothetical protein